MKVFKVHTKWIGYSEIIVDAAGTNYAVDDVVTVDNTKQTIDNIASYVYR